MKLNTTLSVAIVLMLASNIALAETLRNRGCDERLRDDAANPNRHITTRLSGKKIDATALDGENWKEIHCGGGATSGDLYKLGLGPGDPVDPTRFVGKWNVTQNKLLVRYRYGPGPSGFTTTAGPYRWRVFRNTTTGNLCWQENSGGGNWIAETSTPPVDESCP
ncbi:MAG: hypothetical protein WBG92_13260 [Thiohalocapsa sp.]